MHILNDVSLGSRGEGAGAKAIIPLVCYICVRRGGKKVFWTKRGVANPQTPPLYPPLIILMVTVTIHLQMDLILLKSMQCGRTSHPG